MAVEPRRSMVIEGSNCLFWVQLWMFATIGTYTFVRTGLPQLKAQQYYQIFNIFNLKI